MTVFDEVKCGKCLLYALNQPFLTEACASVGIECGKSTGQLMVDVLKSYHNNKHQEPGQGAAHDVPTP